MEQDRLFTEGALVEGSTDSAKQEVVIDLIRAGFGNKRDNHYYAEDVLNENIAMFNTPEGVKMYVDHLDPEAQKALNGSPRPVSHIGGRIIEAWIDKNDAGETVVRGRARIAQPLLWSLIENDPGLLGVSINAWGKAKSGTVEGRSARIVEGISKVGSVDWVTEAGAGGKVVSLIEAQLEQEQQEDEMDAPSDSAVAEIEDDVTRRAVEAATADLEVEDTVEDEVEDVVDAEVDAESDDDAEAEAEDDDEAAADDAEIDAAFDDDEDEASVEADTDEVYADDVDGVQYVCVECNQPIGVEDHIDTEVESRLEEAVRAAVAVVRSHYEGALRESQAEFDEQMALRDQRELSAKLIEATDFKAPTIKALKEQFFDSFFEAELDDDGEVVRSAEELLTEAVEHAIKNKREELSVYTEARVTGQGETTGGSESLTEQETPTESPVDQDIDRFLGIADATDRA